MSLFYNTPSLFTDPLFDSSLVWTPFTRRSRVPDSTQQFIQQKREEFDKLSNEFWTKAEQELKQKQEEERKRRQLQLNESKDGGKDSKVLTNGSGNNNRDTQLANRSSNNDLLSSFWKDVDSGMKIDLKDNDQKYTVTASIPGFDKDHLNLEYNDGLLTISGNQSTEEKSEDGSSYSKSSKYVSRSVRLSDPIDRGSVSAKYDDGQLMIELPKLPKTENKSKDDSIKIQ